MNTSAKPSQPSCFHCGEAVTEGERWTAIIDGQPQPMCCPGCKAIAETIVASGLKDYYRHRTELPDVSPAVFDNNNVEARETLLFYDSDALQKQFVGRDGDAAEATFIIEGISCAACSWLIEHRMAQLPGVEQALLNLSSHRLFLRWRPADIKVSSLIEALLRLGYKATPFSATSQEESRLKENKVAIRRMALAGFGMMQIMMMAIPTYADMTVEGEMFLRLAQMILAIPVILYSGAPFFRAAVRDIQARHLTMDVPVSLAIMLAFLASIWSTFNQGVEVYYSEICMFIFFLLVGRYFEMRARHRMSRAGNNLLTLLPNLALRVENGDDVLIASTDINVGDILRIKPGQAIAADGIVLEGRSSVDEAALTGEYMPVGKKVGDTLIGGTMNVESPLLMQVTATGADAQLSTIMRLLDRAQQAKPRAALIADRVASYFVLAVLLVSLAVFLFWLPDGVEKAFFIALSVLVVTCPCALALATPTALTAATAAMRERGLLISKSHVLETLPQINRVVFDKTGTLTQGRLTLERVVPLADLSETELLSLAAGLEKYSTHPIARAFSGIDAAQVSQPEQISGQGIQGQWQGLTVRLGRADFAWSQPITAPDTAGQWLLLASDQQPLGWIQLNDSLRRSAFTVVKGLQQRGIAVSLLTGDPGESGPRVAAELGISDVRAGMTPSDKLAAVNTWQQAGEKVMMVGDGINDVPVLAGADLSLAVNEASDLAKTNADTLLTNGQLEVLLQSLDTGRKTRRIITQNHAWAIGYNLLALPAAASGLVEPWQAAIGMSLSSVLVVANAMRLLWLQAIPTKEH
ncbi:heavy metal translocating P-type ATPase [Venatoribacter cucullus]|uniref:heavy metal translocating P-type ATPase n=1 Tax=Venatoribacter cucullus TaxID=2661630 RepID=UPI00223EAF2B|nr:heavy metal translocating P-type ATPase [Venatoribacter cucullus]UZK03472.1 cadmium-translocating P-type ATPase [Venatoribacter cucullus]